jgi:hypothetical protein
MGASSVPTRIINRIARKIRQQPFGQIDMSVSHFRLLHRLAHRHQRELVSALAPSRTLPDGKIQLSVTIKMGAVDGYKTLSGRSQVNVIYDPRTGHWDDDAHAGRGNGGFFGLVRFINWVQGKPRPMAELWFTNLVGCAILDALARNEICITSRATKHATSRSES